MLKSSYFRGYGTAVIVRPEDDSSTYFVNIFGYLVVNLVYIMNILNDRCIVFTVFCFGVVEVLHLQYSIHDSGCGCY